MASGARSKFGAHMFAPEVFRKQMHCIEESAPPQSAQGIVPPCIGWSEFADFGYENDSLIKIGLHSQKPPLCICYASVTSKISFESYFLEWRSGGQGNVKDNNKDFTKRADIQTFAKNMGLLQFSLFFFIDCRFKNPVTTFDSNYFHGVIRILPFDFWCLWTSFFVVCHWCALIHFTTPHLF